MSGAHIFYDIFQASVALDTPDVLITGVSQGEPPIKTEPPDDEHRSGPVPGNPEQEDDDVVILETETTIKYLRGGTQLILFL